MILESLISGGILGVIGSGFTNLLDYFKQKQDHKFDLELRELDLVAMEKEFEAQREVSADKLVETSYQHDMSIMSGLHDKVEKSKMSSAIILLIEVVRALIRPILTIYLIVLVHLTHGEAQEIIEKAGIEKIDLMQALAIYDDITKMILFLGSMSVAWWFGSRTKYGKNGGA